MVEKKSKSAKIIQNLEEAEEKRLRTSKGNESMGMNKDSRTLEVKEGDLSRTSSQMPSALPSTPGLTES